jgi:CPA2 family monovalent cation:H+ antiporter-2
MAGVPLNRVVRHVQTNRARRYTMFSGYLPSQDDIRISDDMQPRFLNTLIKEGSPFVGRRLGEVELDALNIEVKAVRRYNVHGAQPSEDMILQAGDVLVLLGLPDELEIAEKRLHQAEA